MVNDGIGLKRGTVALMPYQETWPKLFSEERQRLLEAFNGEVTDIEHIGSTSIPGLAAKPLIDMMAVIDSLGSYQQYLEPLQALGYEFMPERVFDDRVFLPKGAREQRTHHLSLVLKDSPQWVNSLLFRDYLRTHPEARKEYQELKLSLVTSYADDRAAYTKEKSAFIENIIRQAQESNEIKG